MGEAKRKQEDFEKRIAALRISYKQVFEEGIIGCIPLLYQRL